jgi:hypothetical protein
MRLFNNRLARNTLGLRSIQQCNVVGSLSGTVKETIIQEERYLCPDPLSVKGFVSQPGEMTVRTIEAFF